MSGVTSNGRRIAEAIPKKTIKAATRTAAERYRTDRVMIARKRRSKSPGGSGQLDSADITLITKYGYAAFSAPHNRRLDCFK
jgi:ribosomal protein L4